jgi:hypothetical protein
MRLFGQTDPHELVLVKVAEYAIAFLVALVRQYSCPGPVSMDSFQAKDRCGRLFLAGRKVVILLAADRFTVDLEGQYD